MRGGEVRWVRFRKPDKRRPVVILTRDAILEYLRDVTVAPVTSTARDIPTEVPLGPADGMPRDCVVNLDHLQTIPKARVGGLITTLSREHLRRIRQSLLFALGF